jgi:hypothetical protein
MKKIKRIHKNTELHVKIALPIILFVILPSVITLVNEILIKKTTLHY